MSGMFSSKRGRKGGEIACIFVHAGAGYHSLANEHVHLGACNDAAKAAMALLKGGGSAVDAVELAVKILEDREITNAGYGSNLAMDGVVECDAVVVDHFGRSGGVGAVAQVKNPVSLARLLLDYTTQTLSLRRVPPNFLVGQGATNFAYEHRMPILPHDSLISAGARERWSRWRNDLFKAESNRRREQGERYSLSPVSSQHDFADIVQQQNEQETLRNRHTKAMQAGVWNEAQPISPPPSDTRELLDSPSTPSRGSSSFSTGPDENNDATPNHLDVGTDPFGPPGMLEDMSKNPFANSTQQVQLAGSHSISRRRSDHDFYLQHQNSSSMDLSDFDEAGKSPHVGPDSSRRSSPWHDGSSASNSDSTTIMSRSQSTPAFSGPVTTDKGLSHQRVDQHIRHPKKPQSLPIHVRDTSFVSPNPPSRPDGDQMDDVITDTVGAIAVDVYGNIACGASSGGIGMKHRGRIGPAALVGTGAAVVPIDDHDSERTCVATVTSGTGEHMGTTTAASVCSDRVYHNLRKIPGGGLEPCGDDEAIKSFIEKDFMGHTSVKQSHSSGAIGMLTAKKTIDGVYLYFGHNTDSFALASMHSDEAKPVCTMSRSKGNGVIAQGGRAIRYRRKRP